MADAADAHHADMARGADRLLLARKRVKRAAGPGCSCCKDLDEALAKHAVAELRAEIEAITTKAELSLDGEARRCARIKDPLKQAEAIAALIADGKVVRGVVGGFRAAVARYAGKADREEELDVGGSALAFEEVVAWPEPVEGDELLDDMVAAIHRHAHCSAEDAVLGCLWTVHNARRHVEPIGTLPRLVITAGREDAGKTHFALALLHMSETAEHTISPTPANIYRAVETHGCGFFLDEVDDWYRTDKGMREIINSGFNRSGASVLRCEEDGQGKRESRRFSTFTPIALIGINLERVLARTVISRALIVHMRPARAGDEVEDLYDNPTAVARLHVLARKIKRWVADNQIALGAATPERPPGVINRLWITWRPLLAIADIAGSEWPEQARKALEVARARGADPGLGIQLLADAYDIVSQAPVGSNGPRLPTGDLIAELLKLEERVWSIYGKARQPIRDIDVAQLFGPYEVRPTQLKKSGQKRRGYLLCDLEAAIERYAPSLFSNAAIRTRYPRYPGTWTEKSNNPNGLDGTGQVPGTAEPGTGAGTEGVPGTGSAFQPGTGFPEENQCGTGVPGSARGAAENNNRAGNGIDLDAVLDAMAAGVPAGTHCGLCRVVLGDAETEQIGSRRYHADACAVEVHKRLAMPVPQAAPATSLRKKHGRSRIKGAEISPITEGL